MNEIREEKTDGTYGAGLTFAERFDYWLGKEDNPGSGPAHCIAFHHALVDACHFERLVSRLEGREIRTQGQVIHDALALAYAPIDDVLPPAA